MVVVVVEVVELVVEVVVTDAVVVVAAVVVVEEVGAAVVVNGAVVVGAFGTTVLGGAWDSGLGSEAQPAASTAHSSAAAPTLRRRCADRLMVPPLRLGCRDRAYRASGPGGLSCAVMPPST